MNSEYDEHEEHPPPPEHAEEPSPPADDGWRDGAKESAANTDVATPQQPESTPRPREDRGDAQPTESSDDEWDDSPDPAPSPARSRDGEHVGDDSVGNDATEVQDPTKTEQLTGDGWQDASQPTERPDCAASTENPPQLQQAAVDTETDALGGSRPDIASYSGDSSQETNADDSSGDAANERATASAETSAREFDDRETDRRTYAAASSSDRHENPAGASETSAESVAPDPSTERDGGWRDAGTEPVSQPARAGGVESSDLGDAVIEPEGGTGTRGRYESERQEQREELDDLSAEDQPTHGNAEQFGDHEPLSPTDIAVDEPSHSGHEVAAEWDAGETPEFSSARLQEAWDASAATEAGRAYYEPTDSSMREAAAQLKEFPGEYTVDAHGDSANLYYGGTPFDASQVAELVKADPSWQERPVRLFSCETGRGDTPIAQGVADNLDVPVTAPTELAWSGPGDHVVVARAEWTQIGGSWVQVPGKPPRDGGWRRFMPRRL